MATATELFYYGLNDTLPLGQRYQVELVNVSHNGNAGWAIENYSGELPCGKRVNASGQVSRGKNIPDYVTPLTAKFEMAAA